jgi:hypothetical protein
MYPPTAVAVGRCAVNNSQNVTPYLAFRLRRYLAVNNDVDFRCGSAQSIDPPDQRFRPMAQRVLRANHNRDVVLLAHTRDLTLPTSVVGRQG